MQAALFLHKPQALWLVGQRTATRPDPVAAGTIQRDNAHIRIQAGHRKKVDGAFFVPYSLSIRVESSGELLRVLGRIKLTK